LAPAGLGKNVIGINAGNGPLPTPLGIGCASRALVRGVNRRAAVFVDRERNTAIVAIVVGRTRTEEALAALMGDLRRR
jgi:hypothetical protein